MTKEITKEITKETTKEIKRLMKGNPEITVNKIADRMNVKATIKNYLTVQT